MKIKNAYVFFLVALKLMVQLSTCMKSQTIQTRKRLMMAMPCSLLGEETWLLIICWTGTTTLLSFLSGFNMNPVLEPDLFQPSFQCRRISDVICFKAISNAAKHKSWSLTAWVKLVMDINEPRELC